MWLRHHRGSQHRHFWIGRAAWVPIRPASRGPPGDGWAAVRCGQSRPDRGPRRQGEQPGRPLTRHPQASAHRLHRGLRVREVLSRVRRHRRGVAAPDQRDLHGVHPVVHAEPGPARRGHLVCADLRPPALSSKIDGHNIADCSAMQISDLASFVEGIEDPSVGPLRSTKRCCVTCS